MSDTNVDSAESVLPAEEEQQSFVNTVFLTGKVLYCLEGPTGDFVGGVGILDKPGTQYPIHHPVVFDRQVKEGSIIHCIGKLASGSTWRPAREKGKLIDGQGGPVGTVLDTQWFDVKVLAEDLPEETLTHVNMLLQVKIDKPGAILQSRRSMRRNRQSIPGFDEDSPRNDDRVMYEALTGNSTVRLEFFRSDRANLNPIRLNRRRTVAIGAIAWVDCMPAWYYDRENDVEATHADGTLAKRGGTTIPVTPETLRIVISTRLLESVASSDADDKRLTADDPLAADVSVEMGRPVSSV